MLRIGRECYKLCRRRVCADAEKMSVLVSDENTVCAPSSVRGVSRACRPPHASPWRSRHRPQAPRHLQRLIQRSLASLPPLETRESQKTPVADVEHELLHFHPSCKAETRTSVSSNFTVLTNFITEAEEEVLKKEVDPHLTRLKYEFDHWDDAIHGFREIERSRWTKQASLILARVCKSAFPDSGKKLPQTHVLDLAKSGVIKPHVDSVRFCGNIICGLCLLSDAVMRLRHVEQKDQVVDALLKRRSLYIMRDDARYNYTHEVLGEEESFFKGEPVVKERRVSIVSRNEPTEQSPAASTTHS